MTVRREGQRLGVCVEDYGGGVCAEELPLLKEKFKRGSNAGNVEGAGLGLYISGDGGRTWSRKRGAWVEGECRNSFGW